MSAHYQEWLAAKQPAPATPAPEAEPEPKKRVEELFASRAAEFKSQFFMDKTASAKRKCPEFCNRAKIATNKYVGNVDYESTAGFY